MAFPVRTCGVIGRFADPRVAEVIAVLLPHLTSRGVEILVSTAVAAFDGEVVTLACIYSGRSHGRAASTLVLVTSREPDDALYRDLVGDDGDSAGPRIQRIGDCRQPALIAHAVYSGHKAARELDETREAPAAGRDRSIIHGR